MKKTIIVLNILLIFLFSCSGTKKKNTVEINIDGSSTVFPITEAIVEMYREVNPNFNIKIGVSGTGGGFKKFARKEIDINNASREIKQSEIDEVTKNKLSWKEFKIGYDGLAVVVNKKNDFINNITLKELNKIWKTESQGVVNKWSDVNKQWNNEDFHLFGPGTASGTYDYFTKIVNGEIGNSRGDYTASEDDNVLVKGVELDKNSLADFGLAYYSENKNILKLLNVNGIEPSIETVKDGTYPMARPVYIYVSSESYKQKHVKDFVKFYLDNVNKILVEVGYVPLDESDIEKEKMKL